MKTLVSKTLKKFMPCSVLKYRAYQQLIKNPESFLYTSGWMKSLDQLKPIDKHGNPHPWMNSGIVRFLDERLTKELTLFEFGSGYSTLYFASKVDSVTSVEFDKSWLDILKPIAPSNVRLVFKTKDNNYSKSIDKRYDVIVIDGYDRVNCILQSLDSLTQQGVILLDDTKRDCYECGINFIKERGFKSLTFEGLTPMTGVVNQSTIFYRSDNCLDI